MKQKRTSTWAKASFRDRQLLTFEYLSGKHTRTDIEQWLLKGLSLSIHFFYCGLGDRQREAMQDM
jgi:hypothetical protein